MKLIPNLMKPKKKHKSLGQIDMLSSTGSNLRKKINNLKGWKEALTWVWK